MFTKTHKNTCIELMGHVTVIDSYPVTKTRCFSLRISPANHKKKTIKYSELRFYFLFLLLTLLFAVHGSKSETNGNSCAESNYQWWILQV